MKLPQNLKYLEGTKFLVLLNEIGRMHSPTLPDDPDRAFMARVEMYIKQLENHVTKSPEVMLKSRRILGTAGLLRKMRGLHNGKGSREDFTLFLRGVQKYEADAIQGEELPSPIAA